jgi:putative transposase
MSQSDCYGWAPNLMTWDASTDGPTAVVTRTLRLKVRPECYRWLEAAAIEVNQVWNWCHEISAKAARPYVGKGKWLTGFDLNNLSAGASQCLEHIGADTIQRVNLEYALRSRQFRKVRLRFRVSRGARRSLGWVPFKAASLKRRSKAVRFCGKSFRLFETERLDGVGWQQGCFAQDAVGRLVAVPAGGVHRRAIDSSARSGRH